MASCTSQSTQSPPPEQVLSLRELLNEAHGPAFVGQDRPLGTVRITLSPLSMQPLTLGHEPANDDVYTDYVRQRIALNFRRAATGTSRA